MKTLFPAQEKAVKLLVSSIIERGSALNSSCTGSGKTVMACAVARKLHCPVAVIAPKATLPSWKRELAEWGIDPVFVTNYEKIRNGSAHLKKISKKIMRWDLPEGTLVVFDECQRCVKEGSLVEMANGSRKPIELVKVGDFVHTPLGPREVTDRVSTGIKDVVLVSFGDGVIECTYDHKLYTQRGWVEAADLKPEDYLCLSGLRATDKGPERAELEVQHLLQNIPSPGSVESLRKVRKRVHGEAVESREAGFLFPLLRLDSAGGGDAPRDEVKEIGYNARLGNEPPGLSTPLRKDDRRVQSNEVGRDPEESFSSPEWKTQSAPERRKRDRHDGSSSDVARSSWDSLGSRIPSVGPWAARRMALDARGPRSAGFEDSDRSGRSIPQYSQSSGARQKEGASLKRSRVEDHSSKEFRGTGRFKQVRFSGTRILGVEPAGRATCYDLTVDEAHCFYAGGVLVHNCKSPFTQSSQLLISAKMQGVRTLLLSATAAEDPTEMRAIGYALDLHGLNRGTELLPNWDKWMKSFGCFQDQWKNWKAGPVKKLEPLRERLYRDRAVRITERDLPEAFRENWILEDPIEFGAVAKIKKFYEEAGVTTDVIDELLDHIDTFEKEDRAKAKDKDAKVTMMLTRMLRARQLTEALKVPDIVEMTKDMIEEHKSVVIFVNFRETLDALVPALEATLKMEVGFVSGGQKADDRQDYVDRFRDDKLRVIVLNSEAGGTGIDGLQDTHGKFPRVSLISLSFNAKTFKQVLGRIHRANSKSDALQKILVASGTIEEYVLKAIHKKLSNLEALHGT